MMTLVGSGAFSFLCVLLRLMTTLTIMIMSIITTQPKNKCEELVVVVVVFLQCSLSDNLTTNIACINYINF